VDIMKFRSRNACGIFLLLIALSLALATFAALGATIQLSEEQKDRCLKGGCVVMPRDVFDEALRQERARGVDQCRRNKEV
jgi:hypothetical protein